MFTKIRMKNFYSFNDVTFDLSDGTNSYKSLAIVYGENGSGKTNLMSGLGIFIELMRTMDVRDMIEQILYDQEHPKGASEPLHKISRQDLAHVLRSSENLFDECRMIGCNEPVYLQYDFIIKGKKGSYIVEFGADGIIHEKLEYVLEKRKGTYFDLTSDKQSINKALFKSDTLKTDVTAQLKRFWGKHTFLAIILHEMNDKSEQYFDEGLLGNFLTLLHEFFKVSCFIKNSRNPNALISGQSKETILLNIENGSIGKGNVGIIDRTGKTLTSLFKSINSDNQELYYKKIPNGDDSIDYSLRIKKRISGEIRDMPFEFESYGNHQIIDILPFLFRALSGETVVLDEADSGIHDLLYSKIISEAIPHIKGQLIMTTHNTLLLEIPKIKDYIYIVRENEEADREVVTVSESGERIFQQTSIRNKYLSGAFGGAPHVGTIDFEGLLNVIEANNEK